MVMVTKERKEYILNNLLLFMKKEMEENGLSREHYWFVKKFSEEVYLFGIKEPQIEPASEDIEKFISKCPCENDELEIAIKYALAHELLKEFGSDSYKITYYGMNLAEEYEDYLETFVGDNQIVLNDYVKSTDFIINEKIVKSRNLFLSCDIDGALENIWDAFERIKTILEKDKQKGVKKLCENCSTSLSFDDVNNEFAVLTNIGNNYQIRHFETNKKSIKDVNTKVYLYFRMLSLMTFVIKQLSI